MVQYSVVSLWINALDCARQTGDDYRKGRLLKLYDDFRPNRRLSHVCSKPCDSPQEFADMNTGPLDLIRLATHLTLTTDRKKAFLDAIFVDPNGATNSVQGLLDLATGKFNRWGTTTECVIDHGQLNPVRDDIALCAWEFAWTGSGQAYQKKTGFYPRMWLVGSDGKRTMIPAKSKFQALFSVDGATARRV